jgi:arginyl-tRNA synthetase
MFNLLKKFSFSMSEVIDSESLGFAINESDCEATFPENDKYGDISTNLGKVVSSKVRKNPTDVANEIITKIPFSSIHNRFI